MSKQLDVELSKQIANKVKSKAKNSFENAYNAALATEGSIYVQGFLAFAGKPYKPIEHSWIELDEKIIDPTFPHLNKNGEEIYYFAAHRLSVKELKAAIEEAQEDYPEDEPLPIYGATPYEYYGDKMLGGLDYLYAYKQAETKSQELNKPKT